MTDYISILILLAPFAFIFTAVASWFQSEAKPTFVKKSALASAIISIIIAIAAATQLNNKALTEVHLLTFQNLGLSLRIDSLSVLMLSMISLLSFVIIKFSCNYLDGDQRQGSFLGRLTATIASVQMLVISGNLGLLVISWILTSICLHQLLVFYPNRVGAIISARKKFILARLSDTFLIIAALLLYNEFQTGNLEEIFNKIKLAQSSGITISNLELAALALALAAMIKSAQFPVHGWIVEVMETPTPVSALLHAGLLNAGPFLIVRMAFIINGSTYVPTLLMVVGAFTALFASIVYLTQTSVKTALGYSSVAHMGFSLLTCGLGVYSATMLHLVAHSFYKAHAFLSSGSAVDVLKASKFAPIKRIGNPERLLIGFALALVIYFSTAWIWGINLAEQLSLLMIGLIILLGITKILAEAIDSVGSPALVLRATSLAILVTLSFFTLEWLSHKYLQAQIPTARIISSLELVIATSIVIAFMTTIFIQIMAPLISRKEPFKNAVIHLRNGLYVNSYFDKIVGALSIKSNSTN